MVIYTTPCVCVELKADGSVLLIRWKKKPDIEEFKDTYIRVFQITQKGYSTLFFCTDMSKCGSFSLEQETWLHKEYYPLVYSMLKDNIYVGIIFSEEHFKAIISNYKAMESETFHPFMHFNYFTEAKEAFHWLNSIKKGQDAMLIPDSNS